MGDMEINRVLSEMRALSARSTLPVAPAANPQATQAAGEAKAPGGFVDALGNAARAVSDRQMDAAKSATEFQLGRGDLATTMLKMQESGVSFRAAVEVRNRVVAAYQDIMNMPL